MAEPSQVTSPRRALVTGGTGFIGSHLVQRLKAAGWAVHLLSRDPQPIGGVEPHLYNGDMEEVTRAVEASRPDVVFHLASLFLAAHTPQQIAPLIASNVLLGTQLLEAMSAAGVRRFVNTGTSWQFFEGESYRPVNLYAATKQAFEDILAYYTDAAGIRAITLLLFDSYGPGDTRKKLLRLLMDCLETGDPLLMSPGEQVIDLVHVDDLCEAFAHAADLLDGAGPGMRSYALSGGERLPLKDLVGVLGEVAGRPLNVEFGARPYRPREVMQPWSGQALPGWQPRIGLREGFGQLLGERGL
jgi:nucleoside-diphosphate-sugar epimerase